MRLGKVLIGCGVASVLVIGIDLLNSKQADAQSFQCPPNPKIGDQCTQRVTIRLRKVESEGKDEFNQRFEPDAGWAVEDYDCRSGERKRTGEVSGPNCVKVQAGNALTSTSFVDTQVRQLAEHMEKLRIQFGKLPIFADIESRARNEFSSVQQSFRGIQTSNSGVNISAWVAVQGGCRNKSPFGCVNWGPGGSLDTDVIVRLRYVGTNQDVSRILEKYTVEADRAAQTSTEGTGSPNGILPSGLYRMPDGTFISANDSGAFCSFVSPAHFEFLSGRYDLVQSIDSSRISAMANHGACAVRLPAGAYRLVDGRIIASNGSAFCRYVSYEHYERKDRRSIRQFNGEIPLHAMENHFDCAQ
jgi:hypothetical protein